MNPLTNIPPKVRAVLYWCGYILGVIGQGLTIVWGAVAAASPDVSMPLELVIASAVIGLLQTQLNLLAGSNLPSYDDVVDGDVHLDVDVAGAVDAGRIQEQIENRMRGQRGDLTLRDAVVVIAIVVVVLAVAFLFGVFK